MNRSLLPLRSITEPARWDEFVAAHDGHLLQSFAWGELKSRFGWRAERWAWIQHGDVRAAAQVLFRRLAPGLHVAYVPRGPVLATRDVESASAFLKALEQIASTRGVIYLKVEPDWLRGDPLNRALELAAFHPSHETVQPPATIRIDLMRDLDAILAAMKSKWRYNIRLAQKKGVVVHEGTNADLPEFYRLMQITGERDRFAVHSSEYYRAAFELLTANGTAKLLVASFEDKPTAMILVTAFGHEAIYLYGASGNEHRNLMPNHALHWAAIQWAKARGCVWYDLWGIPEKIAQSEAGDGKSASEEDLPSSLYRFKQGFGGEVAQYAGAYDLVFKPLHHTLYRAARRVRRRGLG